MIEKEFLEMISEKNIYVYGAGRNAVRILEYLLEHEKSVQSFIVSDMDNNPATLFNVPVISAEEYRHERDDMILCSVVFGIGDVSVYRDVIQRIMTYGWCDVVFFSKNTFQPIYTWRQRKQKQVTVQIKQGHYCIDKEASAEAGHSVLAMEHGGRVYRWRVENADIKDIFADMQKTFPNKTALEEFQDLYGQYIAWNDWGQEQKSRDSVNLRVYMTRTTGDACISLPELPSWLIPLQVGAVLTDKHICFLRDDQGENISDRNPIYSEGTALYWMWKHAEVSDYIGLFHYRRHIDLRDEDIKRLKEIDILVTRPTFYPKGTRQIFSRFVPDSDIEQLIQAIEALAPEYLADAHRFFAARFYPPCNLFVMRSDIFRQYAHFLFSVTFKIEEYYQSRNVFRYDRYMGYLVECLMGIFLMHHKDGYRIAYADMLFFKS